MTTQGWIECLCLAISAGLGVWVQTHSVAAAAGTTLATVAAYLRDPARAKPATSEVPVPTPGDVHGC